MSCQNCNTNIKSYHNIPNVIGISDYRKPKYCEKCGHPFPWISRQLESAKELIVSCQVMSKSHMYGSFNLNIYEPF